MSNCSPIQTLIPAAQGVIAVTVPNDAVRLSWSPAFRGMGYPSMVSRKGETPAPESIREGDRGGGRHPPPESPDGSPREH